MQKWSAYRMFSLTSASHPLSSFQNASSVLCIQKRLCTTRSCAGVVLSGEELCQLQMASTAACQLRGRPLETGLKTLYGLTDLPSALAGLW